MTQSLRSATIRLELQHLNVRVNNALAHLGVLGFSTSFREDLTDAAIHAISNMDRDLYRTLVANEHRPLLFLRVYTYKYELVVMPYEPDGKLRPRASGVAYTGNDMQVLVAACINSID